MIIRGALQNRELFHHRRYRPGAEVRTSADEPRSPNAVTLTDALAGAETVLSRRRFPWASADTVTVDCWLDVWLLPPLDCWDWIESVTATRSFGWKPLPLIVSRLLSPHCTETAADRGAAGGAGAAAGGAGGRVVADGVAVASRVTVAGAVVAAAAVGVRSERAVSPSLPQALMPSAPVASSVAANRFHFLRRPGRSVIDPSSSSRAPGAVSRSTIVPRVMQHGTSRFGMIEHD